MDRSARLCRHAAWVFLAVMFSLLFVAADARAEDEAVARFERGVQLYDAENYEGALVEWMAAYRISKNYKLLYNVGVCQNALKDYPAATDAFQRYLSEGGTDISAARRTDVQDRLTKLALMVTRVRVSTDAPPGSTIRVDDRAVGTTPINEPITVKLGRRQFSVTSRGRTAVKTMDISSGDQNTVVSLPFADAQGPGPAAPPPEAPVRRVDQREGPSFPAAMWGLTILLGGAATVTGVLALDARNDFERKQATFGISPASLDDAHSKAQTFGIVTDALLGGALLSGVVSTYLTIRYFAKRKREHTMSVLPLGIGYTQSF